LRGVEVALDVVELGMPAEDLADEIARPPYATCACVRFDQEPDTDADA
jgi:hypothetical protein